MNKLTINDIEVAHLRVLVRVDYNVPQDETGAITDDSRIRETLPTLRDLIGRGARIVLMAHLGRPKGRIVEHLRLGVVARRLSELLNQEVGASLMTVGQEAQRLAAELKDGQVLLLENLRFSPDEEKNDAEFSAKLAKLGDVFVNDAFGAAHRAHASTQGVAQIMKSQGKPCVAGLLMAREVDFLGGLLANPQRPFVAILGGVKVSDKIGVIENLLPKVDTLLIGGAMAYAFERAQAREVGTSYFKEEDTPTAARILELARREKRDFRLPQDFLVADKDAEDAKTQVVPAAEIPADKMGMDIGPATIANYKAVLENARTVLWNGPMGRFEVTPFANGTHEVALAVASATAKGAITVIGGGDSAAAVHDMHLGEQMSHVSTGGGASLEFLEGKLLPGVAVLDDRLVR